jgi:hypothetical protein
VTIQECLEKFTLLSNQLQLANQFLKETNRYCRTISSFAQALQEQINLVHFQLADIERRCLKQSLFVFQTFEK